MEKSPSEKKRKILDDSAQENMQPDYQKKDYRKILLNAMFDSKIVKYAALLKDESEQNLFCGQVGQVQDVTIANNPEEDCCFLKFIDFDNDEDEIINCIVKKENLLPLFSLDPTAYEQTKVEVKGPLRDKVCTIKEIRDDWDKYEVHEISNEQLKNHSRCDTRFEIGQLVTVEVNVKQELSNNESFSIQAGQTGIISKDSTKISNTENDLVEVTFWSMPFGSLASERKELVSEFLPGNLDSSYVNSLVTSPWKKIIRIHKNYVFPLYYEILQEID